MKATILVLACVVGIAVASFVPVEPIRPHFSETFEGEGYAHLTNSHGSFWGIGHWAIDQPKGHGIERWEFAEHERQHNVVLLQRYDLGFDYALSFHHTAPHEVCHKHAVKAPMPSMWSWLKEARYRGKHVIDGITYDEWVHHAGGAEFGVAVSETHADRPVYYYRGSANHKFEVHFLTFETRQANSTWFEVPKACSNATVDEPTGFVVEAPAGTADPARPVVPETFEATGSSHHRSHNQSAWGFGRWAIDQAKGHGVENWEYSEHHHHLHAHFLQRYDLSKAFVVTRDHEHHHHCRNHEVKPPMPTQWTWIKDASYIGKHHVGDHIYDQWQWKNSGFTLTLSVHEHQPNRPYYFERRSSGEHFEIHFVEFHTKAPNDTWFVVPASCNHSIELTDVTSPKESPLVHIGSFGNACVAAANNAVSIAKSGSPYVFGGNGPFYDNDGIIASAFASAGVIVPRDVAEQQENGAGCSGGVQLGDLLFQGSPATHVSMVIANNMVAECTTMDGCHIADVNFNDYNGGCRRYC